MSAGGAWRTRMDMARRWTGEEPAKAARSVALEHAASEPRKATRSHEEPRGATVSTRHDETRRTLGSPSQVDLYVEVCKVSIGHGDLMHGEWMARSRSCMPVRLVVEEASKLPSFVDVSLVTPFKV